MTKNELIYTVFEKLKIQSDDTSLSQELVSSLLDSKRAMLLKQQYSAKSWNVPREIKQELCMGMSLVDKVNGYSCAGKILRSGQVMPKTIKIKGKEGPFLVRKEDNSVIAINVVPIERLPFLFSNKFTSMLTYCAIDYDGRLLLVSADNKLNFLQTVKITDVYEKPEEVFLLTCITEGSDYWEAEYPMEAAMADVVINMVVKELLTTMQIPEDNANNATDDRQQQAAQPRRR